MRHLGKWPHTRMTLELSTQPVAFTINRSADGPRFFLGPPGWSTEIVPCGQAAANCSRSSFSVLPTSACAAGVATHCSTVSAGGAIRASGIAIVWRASKPS